MGEIKVAGVGIGAIITAVGLILIWPVDGWNFTGLAIALVGLIGFGGFSRGNRR